MIKRFTGLIDWLQSTSMNRWTSATQSKMHASGVSVKPFFAVGHDASNIVAARHPPNNRKITEYFYLVRSMDGPVADPSASVRGPFDAETFEAEKSRLRLPSFDTNISNLR
jgi:hypothetical protein